MAIPDLEALIEYYVNLLIIQYHNKPKARATIELFVRTLLANNILFQIQDGYNLRGNGLVWSDDTDQVWDDDTTQVWEDDAGGTIALAVGVQLDVLGKYVGVDRNYVDSALIDFFACTDYSEIDPDSDPKFGFCDYATYDDPSHNGTLTYNSIITRNAQLLDDAFRELIFLKILQNNSNHSRGSIDQGIWDLYGPAVRPESNGNMHMAYFISSFPPPSIMAAITKKALPRPMGVGMIAVTNMQPKAFGLTDYTGDESPFAYGFSTYDDYDSLPGQVITYEQIQQG